MDIPSRPIKATATTIVVANLRLADLGVIKNRMQFLPKRAGFEVVILGCPALAANKYTVVPFVAGLYSENLHLSHKLAATFVLVQATTQLLF